MGGGVENLELLFLSSGNRGTGGESGVRGVMQSPAEPGIISGVLSTPELARSLPARGMGELRRSEQNKKSQH